MNGTNGYSPPYVAELRDGEWGVVVPIRGKLAPRIARRAFPTRRDARTWLESEAGTRAVGDLRVRG